MENRNMQGHRVCSQVAIRTAAGGKGYKRGNLQDAKRRERATPPPAIPAPAPPAFTPTAPNPRPSKFNKFRKGKQRAAHGGDYEDEDGAAGAGYSYEKNAATVPLVTRKSRPEPSQVMFGGGEEDGKMEEEEQVANEQRPGEETYSLGKLVLSPRRRIRIKDPVQERGGCGRWEAKTPPATSWQIVGGLTSEFGCRLRPLACPTHPPQVRTPAAPPMPASTTQTPPNGPYTEALPSAASKARKTPHPGTTPTPIPSILAQAILRPPPPLTEVAAVREWLHDVAPQPSVPEATTGYLNFKKHAVMQEKQLGRKTNNSVPGYLDPDAMDRPASAQVQLASGGAVVFAFFEGVVPCQELQKWRYIWHST
ncbi:hypothetical protein JOM56_015469 [Amanita muscaria]